MATIPTTKSSKVAKSKTPLKPAAKIPDVFVWSGKNAKGQLLRGEIRGGTLAAARLHVRKQGINRPSIKKKPTPSGKAIQPSDIAIFIRQLATMMKAGVPLVQSFELVAEGLDNARAVKMVLDIRDEVSGGGSFAGGLRKYPQYFDDLVCSLVESGEQSGALETMLERIAIYKEKTEALKKKIKKALTYPIAVVAVAIIVTGVLLIKVVPIFATTFESFGARLPTFTLFVLGLSDGAKAYWMPALGVAVAASFAFKNAKQKSEAFRDSLDRLTLKLPVVGMIVNEAIIARISRTLSTTFSAGVPLVDALTSVSGAAGNVVYRNAINRVRDDVTAGTPINVAFRATGIFPNLLIQMAAIGEESGALDSMLEKVANHYEAEVDNKVDNLTALLEPLIMSILGVLVGGLLIAMYLPIFQLGSVV